MSVKSIQVKGINTKTESMTFDEWRKTIINDEALAEQIAMEHLLYGEDYNDYDYGDDLQIYSCNDPEALAEEMDMLGLDPYEDDVEDYVSA